MVKQTDACSLAARAWEEPFWISKRAGCSETHRDASLLRSQKSHAGIYCKEQNRKYEDIHPTVKNWDPPPLRISRRALTSAHKSIRASSYRPNNPRDRGNPIINDRLPGARWGLEDVCSFSPPVLLGPGKTNADVFCSSRAFPENLQRSDKQIFASWCRLICFQ